MRRHRMTKVLNMEYLYLRGEKKQRNYIITIEDSRRRHVKGVQSMGRVTDFYTNCDQYTGACATII